MLTEGQDIDMCISAMTVMVPSIERDNSGDDVVTWSVCLRTVLKWEVLLTVTGTARRWSRSPCCTL